MLRQLLLPIGRLVESTRLVLEVRVGTPEPSHSAEPLIDGVELRRYAARVAAETTVRRREEPARQEGFRRLIGYIFGANHRVQQTAITAPVRWCPARGGGQKIAMTAPVAQCGDPERGWLTRFYLPAEWTMDTLPVPLDSRVHLVGVPAETVAVLRFRGDRGPESVAAQTARLCEGLRATGFEPAGAPMTWCYDPLWTIPFLRRNEIAIPVCEYLGCGAS